MSGIRRERPRLRSDRKEITRTDPAGWAVLAIIVVLFVIIFAWIIVTLMNDANADDVVQRCPVGLCAHGHAAE